jgi:hypothetical protein
MVEAETVQAVILGTKKNTITNLSIAISSFKFIALHIAIVMPNKLTTM